MQEVGRAAWRNPDTLLGLLQTAPETLSPQRAASSCNSRFLGQIICLSGFADAAAGGGDLEPHLFAADRAPLMRSVFADPACLAGSPFRAGASG